jgi:hypothetical protein
MIDAKTRAELAVALANLVQGRMTNDDFGALYGDHWVGATDRAVARIAEYGDGLYTDAMTYRLEGVHAVDNEIRKVAERCILFLKTGLEYGWPEPPGTGLQSVVGGFTMFLLLPFGIVLLIAALFLWTPGLLAAGLAVLGLCWLLWKWSRNDDTPEWREYWCHGDREVWPFLRLADYEQALRCAQNMIVPNPQAPDRQQG